MAGPRSRPATRRWARGSRSSLRCPACPTSCLLPTAPWCLTARCCSRVTSSPSGPVKRSTAATCLSNCAQAARSIPCIRCRPRCILKVRATRFLMPAAASCGWVTASAPACRPAKQWRRCSAFPPCHWNCATPASTTSTPVFACSPAARFCTTRRPSRQRAGRRSGRWRANA